MRHEKTRTWDAALSHDPGGASGLDSGQYTAKSGQDRKPGGEDWLRDRGMWGGGGGGESYDFRNKMRFIKGFPRCYQ